MQQGISLYGILLDDTNTGDVGATEVKVAQVDRKGAFKAQSLYCGSGVTIAELEEPLRLLGIFLEGSAAATLYALDKAQEEPQGPLKDVSKESGIGQRKEPKKP
jgi:hypothetical protein